jgi:CheY-like chemotaxis protein
LEALGGQLEIRRSPDGGGSFRMIVPISEAAESMLEAIETDQIVETEREMAESGREAAALRLLVVDDHQVVREGFVGLLQMQKDFEVIGQAGDGKEAVEQAESRRPDAIIMDVDMPKMNGIEATRRIKQRQPAITIIGLSLYEEDNVRRGMAEAGADAYICKNAPVKEVVESIRRSCRRSGGPS